MNKISCNLLFEKSYNHNVKIKNIGTELNRIDVEKK